MSKANVVDASFSSDDRLLALPCNDGLIILWDMAADKQRIVLKGHSVPVESATFCAGGRRLLSRGSDGAEAILWNIEDGSMLWKGSTMAGRSSNAVVSPDGSSFAIVHKDGLLEIRSAQSGDVLMRHELGMPVDVVAYSSQLNRMMILRYHDARTTLQIWNVDPPQLVYELQQPYIGSWGRLSFDGRWCAVADWQPDTGGRVHLLETATGNLRTLSPRYAGDVIDLRFSPDGARFTLTTSDYILETWDTSTGESIASCNVPELVARPQLNEVIEYSPDGRRVIGAALDNRVMFWDASTAALLFVLKTRSADEWILATRFSQSGRLAAAAGTAGMVYVLEKRRDEAAEWLRMPELWLTVVLLLAALRSLQADLRRR